MIDFENKSTYWLYAVLFILTLTIDVCFSKNESLRQINWETGKQSLVYIRCQIHSISPWLSTRYIIIRISPLEFDYVQLCSDCQKSQFRQKCTGYVYNGVKESVSLIIVVSELIIETKQLITKPSSIKFYHTELRRGWSHRNSNYDHICYKMTQRGNQCS